MCRVLSEIDLLQFWKKKSVLCSPAPPGAPQKRRPPARFEGHVSEPIAAWHNSLDTGLGLHAMRPDGCDCWQPETLQESRVWVFTASWAHGEHQNGRPSGGQSEHIPEKGEVPTRGGESSPGPEPTAQHQAPYHTQGKAIQQFKGSTLPVSVISSAFEQCPHGPQEFYTSLSWSAREPGISSSAFSMNT